MPNRIIKESICTSEDIAGLSIGAEILFYHLMVKADDFGVYFGNDQIIKNTCFPLKSSEIKVKQVESWLNELVKAGLLFAYIAEDGKKYVQFVKWAKHQQIRAKKSKYPLYDSTCNQLISDGCNSCRNPIQSNPNEIQSKSAQSANEIEDVFSRLWAMYPKKVGKSAVSKKAKKEIYEAGFDVVASAIKTYMAEIKKCNRDMQYVKNGSTFFNGAWRDYVSDVPEPTQKTKNEVKLNEAGFPDIDFGLSKSGFDF